MNCSILIVTHIKDFHWLKWCLRSVEKYATGFHEVVVSIPEDTDWKACRDLCNGYHGSIPLRFDTYEEWPDKGFVRHMERIICADQICPDADCILHMDPDCFFFKPVNPMDYFQDGKAVLVHATYHWIVDHFQQPVFLYWKTAVEQAIGGVSDYEAMRRHPAVHWKYVYPVARACILKHTGIQASDYIRSTKNQFPQGFAEFPTLGEVAFRHFKANYHWINQATDPWPDDKLIQCWSKAPMEEPHNIWLRGKFMRERPIDLIKQYLK